MAITTLKRPIKITDPDELWCENCLRAGHHEPRGEGCGKLCRWCRDERTDHNKLPTRRLIELHTRGIRITPRVRAEATQRDTEERKARNAKKKKP